MNFFLFFLFLPLLATAQSIDLFGSGEQFEKGTLKFSHGKVFGRRTRTRKDSFNITVNVGVENVEEHFFTQVLDHFNYDRDHRRIWPQRYFINREFFTDPDGPIFLIISAEWEAFPEDLTDAFSAEMAQRMGALLILLEHRYYGKSHPTEDASVENLKWLSSRQALKDLEAFTIAMKRIHGLEHNRWVAFGLSYSACLAAWYRLKFPEQVHAAVASSAPVKIVADFKDYKRVNIASLFAKFSQDCADAIGEATQTIKRLVEGGEREWRYLKRVFNMCEPLEKTPLNVQFIYQNISEAVAGIVQNNRDHIPANRANIPSICRIMTNVNTTERRSPLERYAAMFQFLNEISIGGVWDRCNDFQFASFIRFLSHTEWESLAVSSAFRGWIWQTCTEFGYFQTSTFERGAIFGHFPVEFYLRQCRDTFGAKFTKSFVLNAVRESNEFYGGIEAFRDVTNVIFVNGKIDPWHPLGITKKYQTGSGNTVVFIPDTAHVADNRVESVNDSPSLMYARTVIEHSLREYLGIGTRNSSFTY